MKVFISWSGERSMAFGQAVYQWLPRIIQAVKPYFSPDDITKGSRWSTEIANELERSQLGLIIVTRENLEAPWIMFEAGALSKKVGQAKVCPVLFDLGKTDVVGPLSQFQLTAFEQADMWRLVKILNNQLGRKAALKDELLRSNFEMWWPELKKHVEEELRKPPGPRAAALQEVKQVTAHYCEVMGGDHQLARFWAAKSFGLCREHLKILRTGEAFEFRPEDLDVVMAEIYGLAGPTDEIRATSWDETRDWKDARLGKQYLSLNEQAVARGVEVERIFIYHDDAELQVLADALDQQRSMGIKARVAAVADVGKEYVHNRLVVRSKVHGRVVVEPVRSTRMDNSSRRAYRGKRQQCTRLSGFTIQCARHLRSGTLRSGDNWSCFPNERSALSKSVQI